PDARLLTNAATAESPLTGAPLFSPDGRSLAFWTGVGSNTGTIKRITINGGAPFAICEAGFPYGMSWDRASILFGQQDKGIMRVSPNGGQPERRVSVKEGVAWGPQLLPDGDTVLFTLASISQPAGAATQSWDAAQIVAHSIKAGTRKTLIRGLAARFVPTGH